MGSRQRGVWGCPAAIFRPLGAARLRPGRAVLRGGKRRRDAAAVRVGAVGRREKGGGCQRAAGLRDGLRRCVALGPGGRRLLLLLLLWEGGKKFSPTRTWGISELAFVSAPKKKNQKKKTLKKTPNPRNLYLIGLGVIFAALAFHSR